MIKTLLFIFSFLIITNCLAQDSWYQKADFSGFKRAAAVGFSIGDKGYIGLGSSYDSTGMHLYKDFWEYDPVSDTWSQKTDFPGIERNSAVGFSIGTKGYVGLGDNGNVGIFFKDFWEYDPIADTWTQKADFPGIERRGVVVFSIDKKGYVGTGFYAIPVDQYYKDFWEYDPIADTWTQKADFGGIGREHAVGFSIGLKGYIGTGFNDSLVPSHLKDFWEYNTITNTWIQKTDFIERRTSMTGFSIGSKGYIGTGSDENNVYKKDFWEYDTTLNQWLQKADFNGTQRSSAIGFSIGQKGYIGTGWYNFNVSNYLYKDFWEYTTTVNTTELHLENRIVKFYQTTASILIIISDIQFKEISIYDILGNRQIVIKLSQSSVEINIAELPTGTYIAKIYTITGEIIYYKFIRL